MARELIGTLITNSNGEAFYTYTGTGAGETTFIAESGELESAPLTINDINQELTLTADKSILSYADEDSCTLTATYDGETVSGKSVVFKIGDTVLDTVITDSNGIATYTYDSQGVGDITFTVECMNLQETYELQDCTRYSTTEYTTRQDVQWAMPNGDFEIEADLIGTATTNSYPQLYIGTALNTNHISVGQMTSNGSNYVGMEFKKDNSRLSLQQFNTSQPVNTYYPIKLTRVGNLYTLYWNNQTLTYTNSTILPTYLFIIYLPYGKCKNLKIKPL